MLSSFVINRRGSVEMFWGEMIWIISALIIATSLAVLHSKIIENSKYSDAKSICSGIATMIERIGACPGECSYIYKMPKFSYDDCKLKFSKIDDEGIVALESRGRRIFATGFSSKLGEEKEMRCKTTLKIKKENGKIYIE